MRAVPYMRTVRECVVRIASRSAGIYLFPRASTTDHGVRWVTWSTMSRGGGRGQQRQRSMEAAIYFVGGRSRWRQERPAAGASGAANDRRQWSRSTKMADRGKNSQGQWRQRPETTARLADISSGSQRRRQSTEVAALTSGDSGWRRKRWRPTVTAATAADADNGGSEQWR